MSAFQKWLLWTSSALTTVTGLVYAWMKYLLEPVDPWAVINHPLEPWVLKAHILVGPVLVFAFGLIAVDHVWKHFRCRVPLGRKSGMSAGLSFAPMVVTGYLIQAVTHTGWLTALVVAHLATGLLYVLGLVVHQKIFRRRGNGRRLTVGEGSAGRPAARAAPPGRSPGSGDSP